MEPLLEVLNLKTYFYTPAGVLPAVDDVSFHVNSGETLCIVGESGCGKSVTTLSIMQLVPTPPGRYVQGQILFEGQDLLSLPKKEMTDVRGNEIAMIFQEPMTSLNPVHTIGKQIAEGIRVHEHVTKEEAFMRSVELLKTVGVPDAERVAKCFPHQLSGGMRQRAMIAIALACKPKLLLADEPTTALDVTIQAQILDLIRELKQKTGMTVMLITHDLGVVAEMAQRVIVMYAGKIVEQGDVNEIFANPLHPYTEGLLKCIPRIDIKPEEDLYVVKGNVPNLLHFSEGCHFYTRCSYCKQICIERQPALRDIGKRKMACHFLPNERCADKGELP